MTRDTQNAMNHRFTRSSFAVCRMTILSAALVTQSGVMGGTRSANKKLTPFLTTFGTLGMADCRGFSTDWWRQSSRILPSLNAILFRHWLLHDRADLRHEIIFQGRLDGIERDNSNSGR